MAFLLLSLASFVSHEYKPSIGGSTPSLSSSSAGSLEMPASIGFSFRKSGNPASIRILVFAVFISINVPPISLAPLCIVSFILPSFAGVDFGVAVQVFCRNIQFMFSIVINAFHFCIATI